MGIKDLNAPPCFGAIAHLVGRGDTQFGKGASRKHDFQSVVNDRLSGMPIKKVAEKHGCHISFVVKAMREYKDKE